MLVLYIYDFFSNHKQSAATIVFVYNGCVFYSAFELIWNKYLLSLDPFFNSSTVLLVASNQTLL